MRVAFVSEWAPGDLKAFSGIPYFMADAISSRVDHMEYVHAPMFNWKSMLSFPSEGRLALQTLGQSVSETLRKLQVDVVVCQGSSMIPFLETRKPVVLWHDSTWQCLLQVNSDELKRRHPLLWEWDKSVFHKCVLIAFAAEWVLDQSLANYLVDSRKLKVLPFGANICAPTVRNVTRAIKARQRQPCQLAFVGVDWRRKGLTTAYALANRLCSEGYATRLNVIGTEHNVSADGTEPFTGPRLFDAQIRNDTNVHIAGFLDKTNPTDLDRFVGILSTSHFLVHPANFECFGIALTEANALGVPVLASDNQGPRTIVRNAMNGHLFSLHNFVAEAATVVKNYMEDYNSYTLLAKRARHEYDARLNWDTSVAELLKAIRQL
jgi:glycosyltransferase involved in cell wall biosynthesis